MILKKLSIVVLLVLMTAILLPVFAQPNKSQYPDEWKRVDKFMGDGLTASALDEVTKIYQLAKMNNNDAQIIKALIYRVNLQNNYQEDAQIKNIREVEKEVAMNKEPARSILSSITARLYWNYFEQNRWKFYNRTNTEGLDKTDVETWTIDDFVSKVSALYLASIEPEKILQKTMLQPFEPILEKGNSRQLRPTLYDLLAHRALEFFKNDERNITKPAYAFEIKDEAALASAAVFARHNFSSKDSSSLHLKAIKVYQELIRLHMNDKDPAALIDVDIERIEFVKSKAVMQEKEMLYRKALEAIVKQISQRT